jgi:integrase
VARHDDRRRGELCAVRWSSINLEPGRETLWLRHAITRTEAGWTEGGLKTHQQRRIALDGETAAILGEHRDLWAERFAALGLPFNEDGYAFANVADGTEPPSPDGSRSDTSAWPTDLVSGPRSTSCGTTRRLS